MTKQSGLRWTAMLALAAGTAAVWAEAEKPIALADVPAAVLAAAEKAAPGLKIAEAEVRETGKGRVYEVEGSAHGKHYEINIAADGKVLSGAPRQDDDDDTDDEKEGEKEDDSDDKSDSDDK